MPGFAFTAPSNELLESLISDSSMVTFCLASASLKPRRKNQRTLTLFFTLPSQYTVKFGCQLEMDFHPLRHISSSFLTLNRLLLYDLFFTSWKLSWVRSCQEGTLSIVPAESRKSFFNGANLNKPQSKCLTITLSFLVLFFFQTAHFVFLNVPLIHFHCISLHKNYK